MRTRPNPNSPLLTSPEVAEIFCVSQKTVTSWAQAGKIPALKTPGGGSYGHWRFRLDDIRVMLNGPVKP